MLGRWRLRAEVGPQSQNVSDGIGIENIICSIPNAKLIWHTRCRPLACESPQSVGLVTADDLIFIVVESLDIEELESESDFLMDILTSFTSGTGFFIGFG